MMDSNSNAADILEKYGRREPSSACKAVESAHLAIRCPLDNGRHNNQPPLYSLGWIDRLPAELIIDILILLDLPMLTDFRRVNRRAMDVVDSLPPYAMVVKYCPDVLRAILGLGSRNFDCATLFRTLCTTRCSACDRFGDRLYLITCRRACEHCLYGCDVFHPINISRAVFNTRLNTRELKRLPHVVILPGFHFPPNDQPAKIKLVLLDNESLSDRIAQMPKPPSSIKFWPMERYLTSYHRCCRVVISAPYFASSAEGRTAHWGYCCNECRSCATASMDSKIKRTEDDFKKHLEKHLIANDKNK